MIGFSIVFIVHPADAYFSLLHLPRCEWRNIISTEDYGLKDATKSSPGASQRAAIGWSDGLSFLIFSSHDLANFHCIANVHLIKIWGYFQFHFVRIVHNPYRPNICEPKVIVSSIANNLLNCFSLLAQIEFRTKLALRLPKKITM